LKNEGLNAPYQKTAALAEPRTGTRTQGFTRKDYLHIFKTLSTATASRDLNAAVKNGVLKRMGEGNQARYGEKH
jgi:hypothetical protein